MEFCKKNIQIKSNIKTNSLIDSQNLYYMILDSIKNNNFILFNSDNIVEYKFNILNAFLK